MLIPSQAARRGSVHQMMQMVSCVHGMYMLPLLPDFPHPSRNAPHAFSQTHGRSASPPQRVDGTTSTCERARRGGVDQSLERVENGGSSLMTSRDDRSSLSRAAMRRAGGGRSRRGWAMRIAYGSRCGSRLAASPTFTAPQRRKRAGRGPCRAPHRARRSARCSPSPPAPLRLATRARFRAHQRDGQGPHQRGRCRARSLTRPRGQRRPGSATP